MNKEEYKSSVISVIEDLLQKLKDDEIQLVINKQNHFNDRFNPETSERLIELSGFYTLSFDIYHNN